mmetsp:Transcript_69735/g.145408  ORF Transcript_69735/g.145408 Transcript_69735/m.145408 type:complete len:126 (-) Transcript_69735:106-483(-)|eukprot:CAMPEP_0181298466 /NCGR_PEP_ID=MMETSP1101-20121128/5798_1 /TAXON_ID=46948 /ORGANISM="Rhodomonas abbreviata, Strain Caron Lab Isolate" /LENGTH=125 /DNA_ID=CAMNT_0023403491 /DNA_START=199 /DNA_END=576 /DNA_ORIENTATION=-
MSEQAAPAAVDNRQEMLAKAATNMFEKVSKHLQGELYASTEDYKLLEKMNGVTTEKFQELTNQAAEINKNMDKLQEEASELIPTLDQIDVLETSVEELMNTATLLDDYSKNLEAKYKEVIIARRS